jgi:pimeloyl-ACP methyl ester carboxylesterase
MYVALLLSLPGAAACAAERAALRYRSLHIENVDVFVREAGAPSAPAILLLHGNPSSSHMFRDVIPDLARRFHVIAPDYPGFGYSSAPPPRHFKYTFDHYATIVREVLAKLGVHRFGLVMQDYGVPVGFRLAAGAPGEVSFLVVQNGQICHAVYEAKTWLDPFWERRDPAAEARLRRSYVLKATKLYYSLGAHDTSRISPDAWTIDQFQMDQPGSKDARTEITYDYPSNFRRYAAWQAYLRKYRPPTLVIWGKGDPLFTVDQSRCYAANNPRNSTTKYFEGGHFMLEEHAHEAALDILEFTARLHLD